MKKSMLLLGIAVAVAVGVALQLSSRDDVNRQPAKTAQVATTLDAKLIDELQERTGRGKPADNRGRAGH